MILFKKIFVIFFSLLIKIINILGILTVIFGGVILYAIISETPIKLFNKYIEERIFHNLVKIEKINLKWDYNIKKPVLVINNINYNNPDNNLSFSFNYLGMSFDIKKLLINHKLYPIYISLEGLRLDIANKKDNTFTMNIEDIKRNGLTNLFHNVDNQDMNVKNNNQVITANDYTSLLNLFTMENIQKKGIFDIILTIKKQYDILSLLNTIDIDYSNIVFRDEINTKVFNINIHKMNFNYVTSSNTIVLKSNGTIQDMSSNKVIDMKGHFIADRQKNILFHLNMANIPPNLLLIYSKFNLNNNIRTAGLSINADVEGNYQFASGFKSVNADLSVDEGDLFIKGMLADKLKINTIKTRLSYNLASNKIIVHNVDIRFSNRNPLKLVLLNGGHLPIKNAQFNANLDLSKQLYNFNNIKINLLDKLFTGEIQFNKGNTEFKLETHSAINVNEIKNLWTSLYLTKIRNWVVNNVTNGLISKVQLFGNVSGNDFHNMKLNKIYGSALATNVELTYLNSLPAASAEKVLLEFDNQCLSFKYFNGVTGNIFSKEGEVNICDEYPDKPKFFPLLNISSKIEGNIVDGLLFINNPPLNILNKIKLDAHRFTGDAGGSIYLEYVFGSKQLQNIELNLTGHNVSFKNAFKNKDVTKANLNVVVKDKKLITYGTGEYYDMPINIYLDANWNPNANYALKLNIDSKDISLDKVKNLNVLPMMLQDKLSGYVDLSAEMLQLKKSQARTIVANLDLTNTNIHSFPYIDYSKKAKEPLNAIVNLSFVNNKLIEIKQLTLDNKSLSAQMKIALNEDKSINVVMNKFIMKDNANVKGYLFLSKDNININLTGNFLNFEWIKSGLNKEKMNQTHISNTETISPKEPTNTSKDSSYIIKTNIKKLFSNQVTIENFYSNIEYSNQLNNLIISGDMNTNDNITIVYDKNTHKIAYNISNLGSALKFLQLTTKIKRGNLNGQINYNKDKFNNTLLDGTVLIKSFSLGVIPFTSANIAFTSQNNQFNIINLALKGNVVGGMFNGTYYAKERNLFLEGFITPIWSTSRLLVNIPILGDFLKSNFAQYFLSSGVHSNKQLDNKNDGGAVNIPFSIYGNINELQYSFNQNKKNKHDQVIIEEDNKEINNSYLLDPSYYIDNLEANLNYQLTY